MCWESCCSLCHLCFYLQGVYSVNDLSVCPAGTHSGSGSINAPPSLGGPRDPGPHGVGGGGGGGGAVVGGVTRAKSRERDARPPRLLPPR